MLLNLHIPTLMIVFILTCACLAIPAGTLGASSKEDGLRAWSLSLWGHAAGYALIGARGVIPDYVSIVVANIILSGSYSLFLLAAYQFYERPARLDALLLPPVLVGVIFSCLLGDIRARVIVGNTVIFIQAMLMIRQFLIEKPEFQSRGRRIVLLSLAMVSCVLVARVMAGLFRPEFVSAIFETSPVQSLGSLVGMAAVVMGSSGYIIMTKERSDHRLRAVAMKDRLTGCWNRIKIEEVARQEMARLERYSYPVSLVIIDLDHFKRFNDEYGHSVGDLILKTFAELAQSTLRTTDVLGRWGGEEFIIILPSSGFPEAIRMAERLRIALEEFTFPGGYRATASFGVAVCQSIDTWEDWLNRADAALYLAKEKGRNRVKAEGMEIDPKLLITQNAMVFQLRWSDEYASGQADIDEQHQALFARANEVLRTGTDGADKKHTAKVMRELITDVRNHFIFEEIVLDESAYVHLRDHAAIHRRLLDRANVVLEKFESHEVGVAEMFHFVIYELIVQHILIEDRKYHDVSSQAAVRLVETH